MSLDYEILSNKRHEIIKTGIFIRIDGRTKEITSKEEFKEHFGNIEGYQEYKDKTNVVFKWNITHNLSEMADKVIIDNLSLYNLLWHPNNYNYQIVNEDYINKIKERYKLLKNNKTYFEKYNPDNNWGNYDSLLMFVKELINFFDQLDLMKEIYKIETSC